MLVILNPTAGSPDEDEVARRRERIERLPDVEVREMNGPGLPALGVLPLGTANDFARNLELPLELEEAVDVLVRGRRWPLDLGEIDPPGDRFINVSVGGFAGRIEDHVDSDRKRAWGLLTYVRSAMEALPELEPFRLELELDGDTERLAAYQVVVANGRRTGGNIPVAPEAEMDDGRLDVVVFRAVEPPELVVLASKILVGQHLESEAVLYRRAERVTVGSEPSMRFRADGEEVGETPLHFRVRPRALEVVRP